MPSTRLGDHATQEIKIKGKCMLEIMERVRPDAYTEVIGNVNELVIEMGAKARARNNRKEEEDETGQLNE